MRKYSLAPAIFFIVATAPAEVLVPNFSYDSGSNLFKFRDRSSSRVIVRSNQTLRIGLGTLARPYGYKLIFTPTDTKIPATETTLEAKALPLPEVYKLEALQRGLLSTYVPDLVKALDEAESAMRYSEGQSWKSVATEKAKAAISTAKSVLDGSREASDDFKAALAATDSNPAAALALIAEIAKQAEAISVHYTKQLPIIEAYSPTKSDSDRVITLPAPRGDGRLVLQTTDGKELASMYVVVAEDAKLVGDLGATTLIRFGPDAKFTRNESGNIQRVKENIEYELGLQGMLHVVMNDELANGGFAGVNRILSLGLYNPAYHRIALSFGAHVGEGGEASFIIGYSLFLRRDLSAAVSYGYYIRDEDRLLPGFTAGQAIAENQAFKFKKQSGGFFLGFTYKP